jgi:hypothetical protein
LCVCEEEFGKMQRIAKMHSGYALTIFAQNMNRHSLNPNCDSLMKALNHDLLELFCARVAKIWIVRQILIVKWQSPTIWPIQNNFDFRKKRLESYVHMSLKRASVSIAAIGGTKFIKKHEFIQDCKRIKWKVIFAQVKARVA